VWFGFWGSWGWWGGVWRVGDWLGSVVVVGMEAYMVGGVFGVRVW